MNWRLSLSQVTRCSSSSGSSASYSCTGTTTSLCCCTPGSPIGTRWLAPAGSWPWTTRFTRSCIHTTLRGQLDCGCPAPSPWWSRLHRSCKWRWAWLSWVWCTSGWMRSTVSLPWTTSHGDLSCTSATWSFLPFSSMIPTSKAPPKEKDPKRSKTAELTNS